MELLSRFRAYIQKHNLFHARDRLLLAVSGGVDSVVLCELCRLAGYDFIIAHCNFQLRGEESMRDENFVKHLGAGYGVEVLVKRFDTQSYARDHSCSIQVAARELRYGWFREILAKADLSAGLFEATAQGFPYVKPAYLVTAHHADDNIETVLMNFFKGTGLAGLRGILPKQGNIVRPLLFATKESIKQFAAENTLQWVEDSSNAEDAYTRNYIRHNLVPVIREIYPQVESNLSASIERFRDIEILYRQKIEDTLKKLVEKRGEELHIPIVKLQKTQAAGAVVYELIQPFGFTSKQVDEVLHLLESETGKYVVSSTHRILKNRNWLIIAPLRSMEISQLVIEESEPNVCFPGGQLRFTKEEINKAKYFTAAETGEILPKVPYSTDNNIALLDARDIEFPLILRKWKPGDYFYPLGMRKKKKLARFFIDQKLSATDKERVWVLEMDKKIIWVVGMRIDDRFKITEGTKQALKIEFIAA